MLCGSHDDGAAWKAGSFVGCPDSEQREVIRFCRAAGEEHLARAGAERASNLLTGSFDGSSGGLAERVLT